MSYMTYLQGVYLQIFCRPYSDDCRVREGNREQTVDLPTVPSTHRIGAWLKNRQEYFGKLIPAGKIPTAGAGAAEGDAVYLHLAHIDHMVTAALAGHP